MMPPENTVQIFELSSLSNSEDTLFAEGFQTPWRQKQQAVPWQQVQEMLGMARSALVAKQQAAEALFNEIDHIRKSAADSNLLERAQRAEVDSGLLLGELQALIRAKSDVAQQRADLDRANALLMAERELLCEQLDVSPDNVNLCQAVQKVLAGARRTRGLEVQLRLLARQHRDTLLQLEAAKESEARMERHWQACEQAYLQCLAAHGIPRPQLPPLPRSSSSSRAADAHSTSSSGGASCSDAVMYAQLQQQLSSSCVSASSSDAIVGSPGSNVQPPTPPASDFNACGGPLQHMRRSHSLDSGLNSLTGLLDQLALGQLGSDECDEYERDSERDPYMLVDAMSDEGKTDASARSTAAGAAAALMLLGSGASAVQQKGMMHVMQQQLQPVQEDTEDQY